MPMKTSLTIAFAISLSLAYAGHAHAQGNPSGRYQLEVEQTSDTCGNNLVAMGAKAELVVTVKGNDLVFKLPDIPILSGPKKKRGKFRVGGKDASARRGGTIGTFAATGRFDPGVVRMIVIAEHVKDGKTQCAQSWNITGKR
jgi:hypothetical protein